MLQDAVTARVDDGNDVTLARSTPGVFTVRDHLDVESDEASSRP